MMARTSMINPGLPDLLWMVLDGRLWHATSHQGLIGIVEDRFIHVSRGERYRNSICRRLECVSLFDFGQEALEQDDFMGANWFPWLGSEHAGRCAIWLEVDREHVANKLIDPKTLLEIVRTKKIRGRFFQGVESCHKGPLTTRAIVGALVLDCQDCSVFQRYVGAIDNILQMVASFLDALPPPRPDSPLVRALRKGRR
jgi:hypothetical protein